MNTSKLRLHFASGLHRHGSTCWCPELQLCLLKLTQAAPFALQCVCVPQHEGDSQARTLQPATAHDHARTRVHPGSHGVRAGGKCHALLTLSTMYWQLVLSVCYIHPANECQPPVQPATQSHACTACNTSHSWWSCMHMCESCAGLALNLHV